VVLLKVEIVTTEEKVGKHLAGFIFTRPERFRKYSYCLNLTIKLMTLRLADRLSIHLSGSFPLSHQGEKIMN
jgi:hypothetical protein